MHSNPNSATEPGNNAAKALLHLPSIHILLLIIVGVACYANTFHVPMLLDDEGSIQLHDPVHGLANYFRDGWVGYNFLPNRAFGYLTFALNYEFGGLRVTGYHLVNLVIHIGAGLLVYALVRLTFRTPFLQCDQERTPAIRLFAFVVALLFVCHPVQTQAITYIVQRFTSLTTLFYLAAIVCYLRWRLNLEQAEFTSPAKRITWYILALGATVLAMKTKEISFTLPVIILLYERSFFGFPGRKLLAKLTPLLLTIVIIPVTTFFHVGPVVQSSTGGGSFLSDVNAPAYNIVRVTRWEYLYTQFSVICTYLRLLFFPSNQNLDYDYPINRTLLAPRAFLSLLLLLAIVMLALFMYAKSRKNRVQAVPGEQIDSTQPFASSALLRLAAFGIFWFFITLSIESSIITIQDVIYEHRVYLPSFGFFLSMAAVVTLGLSRLTSRFQWLPKLTCAIAGCIVVILSVATYSRNNVWRDWLTLWGDNVAKSPAKPRPHNILGIGYFYRGNFDEAMREYREAVRLRPDYIEAYYNMGLIHKARKEHNASIVMFLKALAMTAFNEMQYAKMYNEIGINYGELGDPDQAITAFASAVKYGPESIEYRNNYAYALWMKGQLDDALREFQAVLRMEPGNSYAMNALQEIKVSNNL